MILLWWGEHEKQQWEWEMNSVKSKRFSIRAAVQSSQHLAIFHIYENWQVLKLEKNGA